MSAPQSNQWQLLWRVLRWLGTVVVIMAVVFGVKMVLGLFLSNDQVAGNSMQPTLKNGDRLVVVTQTSIKRNAIVTLKSPIQADEQYIKRVIGLPGDTVSVKNDQLYINGKRTAQPYLKTSFIEKSLRLSEVQSGAVTGGQHFTPNFSLATLKATQTARVPKGSYFVLGDNRPVSYDSRKFGFVKRSDIYGVVKWRYWPLNQMKTF
ncbi:MAG: signal peptidase I [Lactobacillus sp.]|uniref:Signal peptidase I n=1 Tax=Lacticaseibacillus suilingensis TaxID=2799577 RepID=A0ABW4BC27_9LACO|nr:signal peptidase I [Lacticaseibacillus suilingensis]MCI1893516.1 signal peptidase I [Lactobacillus sp.]MCI1916814.1 signal peptidase I [Lactobacillus sp.]MCI1940977.1 signal peptidase I [Lactobacillus sp.]MCI1971550.1 signal peptidase I [Lactobacillus sp.]MCI2016047.1 signal peptidase I [Lactobacillus sp.]